MGLFEGIQHFGEHTGKIKKHSWVLSALTTEKKSKFTRVLPLLDENTWGKRFIFLKLRQRFTSFLQYLSNIGFTLAGNQ